MTSSRLPLLAAAIAAALACDPAARVEHGKGDAPVEVRRTLETLAQNGLAENGLGDAGLATTAFSIWFKGNPELSHALMDAVVRCAVPAGSDRTWIDPSTGARHVWRGEMGLAPKWSSGAAATNLERHLLTVCLSSVRSRSAPEPARVARSAL